VTSRDDLQGIAQGIRSALPPLAGVVQGAALLEDTALRNMTYEKMIKVLRPKIDGSVHLDSLFSNVALDFFIFLSSTTMVLGNIGQANYTAANAFMSTLAAQRRAKGLAASVLNLGPVLGVGYVDRAVGSAGTELLRRGGYIFLSEWNFHQLFAEAVLASPPDSGRDPEITASPRHVSADDTYKPIWSGSPKFRHLVTQASTSDIASGSSVDAPVKTRLLGCDSVSEAYDIIKGEIMLITPTAMSLLTDCA
jgi:hybrid polyketide synthase/nonribosomal peptide synthetase ACE1